MFDGHGDEGHAVSDFFRSMLPDVLFNAPSFNDPFGWANQLGGNAAMRLEDFAGCMPEADYEVERDEDGEGFAATKGEVIRLGMANALVNALAAIESELIIGETQGLPQPVPFAHHPHLHRRTND